MYLKTVLTASLLALLSGPVAAQGQYGAIPNPNQSMAPESSSNTLNSMGPQSNTPTGTSSIVSNSATPTPSSYSTPSTLSSSVKPTSSATPSDSGMLGGLLHNKKLNLRAEPGPLEEFTRAMPSSEYSQPASQPAAYPTI
ncbi:hypothetical protein PENDEC_c016G06495 [Penicillium decumbens]|uniref:Uncharacterized protein n=1 Tax=Penicillium decumbens TaxID=69771 RepID=A0A1V6P945_PENDC|nr:hypothetical protein PENDEC_c016G06495 [Penicillium decumbens]